MSTKKNTAPVEEQAIETAQKDLAAENEALRAALEAMKAQQHNVLAEEAPKETGPRMVKIKLPKTKELKEDVFVAVNFRTYQIQRGVEVEVPDFVAEVLENQQKMLEEIMLFEEKMQH